MITLSTILFLYALIAHYFFYKKYKTLNIFNENPNFNTVLIVFTYSIVLIELGALFIKYLP